MSLHDLMSMLDKIIGRLENSKGLFTQLTHLVHYEALTDTYNNVAASSFSPIIGMVLMSCSSSAVLFMLIDLMHKKRLDRIRITRLESRVRSSTIEDQKFKDSERV